VVGSGKAAPEAALGALRAVDERHGQDVTEAALGALRAVDERHGQDVTEAALGRAADEPVLPGREGAVTYGRPGTSTG
jgi:hypothetical protein